MLRLSSVVCLSSVLCLSVGNGCIAAKRKVLGEDFLHEHLAQCRGSPRRKFRRGSAKGTFLHLELNGGGRKNMRFSTENGPCFGNCKRIKVTINH